MRELQDRIFKYMELFRNRMGFPESIVQSLPIATLQQQLLTGAKCHKELIKEEFEF